MFLKDAVANDHIAMKETIDTINVNDSHRKWVHQGEEQLHNMVKLKGFILVVKLKPCDSCRIIKTKATTISTVSDLLNKASTFRESLFVDITGPFPLAARRWHKAIINKLL